MISCVCQGTLTRRHDACILASRSSLLTKEGLGSTASLSNLPAAMSNRHTVTSSPQQGFLVALLRLLVFSWLGSCLHPLVLPSFSCHVMSPSVCYTRPLTCIIVTCIMIDYVPSQRICIYIYIDNRMPEALPLRLG